MIEKIEVIQMIRYKWDYENAKDICRNSSLVYIFFNWGKTSFKKDNS